MELRNRNILFNADNRPNLCYPFYVNPIGMGYEGVIGNFLGEEAGICRSYAVEIARGPDSLEVGETEGT